MSSKSQSTRSLPRYISGKHGAPAATKSKSGQLVLAAIGRNNVDKPVNSIVIGLSFDGRQTAKASCENKTGRGKNEFATVMALVGAQRYDPHQPNLGSCQRRRPVQRNSYHRPHD